jgi:hypothetical protein
MERLAAISPRPSLRRREPPLLAAAWAASVLLIVSLATLGVTGREAVMRAWPPSTRLYQAVGAANRAETEAVPAQERALDGGHGREGEGAAVSHGPVAEAPAQTESAGHERAAASPAARAAD